MKIKIHEIFNENYSIANTLRLLGKEADGIEIYGGTAKLENGSVAQTSFDLIRLIKFGDLDENLNPKTPVNKKPSWLATIKYVQTLDGFNTLVHAQKFGKGREWMGNLTLNENGEIEATIPNLREIFRNDVKLHGLAYNTLQGKRLFNPGFLGRTKGGNWEDAIEAYLYEHLSIEYKLNPTRITKPLELVLHMIFNENSFNPLADYLSSLKWDKTERLERVFVDYLGCEDTPYTRAVTRRKMIATVARALQPGCKHDECLILSSAGQGAGKNTMLQKLAKQPEWFNEALNNLNFKDTLLEIQTWIVVSDELDSLRKAQATEFKSFMSRLSDNVRVPYGRNVELKPRRCSFFGTTNAISDIINDPTGGRRFWIIACYAHEPVKDVFTQLEAEVDQIWAEAVYYFKQGEQWHLTDEEKQLALEVQEHFKSESPWAGVISEFLDRKLPDRWDLMTKQESIKYLQQNQFEDMGCAKTRNVVCALEIWNECLNLYNNSKLDTLQSKEITKIMNYLPGWRRGKGSKRFGEYGRQRYWERI